MMKLIIGAFIGGAVIEFINCMFSCSNHAEILEVLAMIKAEVQRRRDGNKTVPDTILSAQAYEDSRVLEIIQKYIDQYR